MTVNPETAASELVVELFRLAWDDDDRDRVLTHHLHHLTDRQAVEVTRCALLEVLDVLQAVLDAAGTSPAFARVASAAISNRQFERVIGRWEQ